MRNDFESNYLMHHGIYGQKWGIRRYQNPDGSLTEAGRKRYGVGAGEGIDDIRSEKGTKRRIKDVKKSIAKNNKARGKEYSKIANNPENFLGLNKKHGKKIEEYSENIKKGEEELNRLFTMKDAIDYDKRTKWDEWDEQKSDDLHRKASLARSKDDTKWESDSRRTGIHDDNNENHKAISEKRLSDGFGKIPNDWKDVYSDEEAKDVSFSIQAIGKGANDVEFRINNHNSGISNDEAAKKSKEFLDTFDDAKARKAIADEYYPYVKEQYPNISKAQFENSIEAYSVDTYPKWNSYEVHYDDGGLLGGHSLDIEGDMKTGKIKYHSMNG